MPNPLYNDVHVNVPLTNMSVAYIQAATNFIAGRVFPSVPVRKQSDRYFVYTKADWFRNEVQERAPSTESVGGGWRIDNTPTYYCRPYAIHKDIDDQLRPNVDDPINMDRDAAEWLAQQHLLNREKLWVNTFFKTSVWGKDWTGVTSGPTTDQFVQWDQTGSTPMKDIALAKTYLAEQTGYMPNRLVLGPRVYDVLINNTDILDRIKYTQRGVVTTDLLAGLFGVDQVLVPYATINSAVEPLAESMGLMYGKAALLCYAAPAPSILTPSAGYTFAWTGFLGAGAEGLAVRTFRMEAIRSDRVEAEMAFDQKLVCADVGLYFDQAIA